jgi:catechol 2,3-dioxygenase-like lactoylglutathione lyase family enzyme
VAPDIAGFAPLIQVFDMPRAVGFYRDVLGFEVMEASASRGPDDFDWCLLRLGEAELMLNTAYEHGERPPEPEPSRVRAHDDIAFFFGCRDLDAAHAHLREKGVTVEPPCVVPYGMRQLHLKDPDGYGICLQWPAQ